MKILKSLIFINTILMIFLNFNVIGSNNDIIIRIKRADMLKENIKYNITNNIIGYKNGIEIYEITGKCSTLLGLMSIFGEYYTVEAVKIEIAKVGLYIIKNKIGIIAADGEQYFAINEQSKFDFIASDTNRKMVKITTVNDDKSSKQSYYILSYIDNVWKVSDEIVINDLTNKYNNWISVRSSSYLFGTNIPYRNYCAMCAFDDNVRTTWVEGVNGNGIGEWIEFTFFYPQLIYNITIINGYAKTEQLYNANNRIKKLRVSFADSASFEIKLEDNMIKPQQINLASPKRIERMCLTILDVYQGVKYDDTCISEISFE